MTVEGSAARGGCICGAIRYEASGNPISVIFCHCESCRKHSGSPVSALAGFHRSQLRFTRGERATYESSPGIARGFCGDCGTTPTWEGNDDELGPLVEIHIGTADEPGNLAPQIHLHHAEKVPWFETSDSLPRYREWEDS